VPSPSVTEAPTPSDTPTALDGSAILAETRRLHPPMGRSAA
jgi:hypothetical protein